MVSTIVPASRIGLLQFIGGLAAIVAAHAAYTFVFYRARVLTHSAVALSDLLLFALPATLAFTGYFFLLRARGVRRIQPWIGAFLLTVLSFSLSLLLPLARTGHSTSRALHGPPTI